MYYSTLNNLAVVSENSEFSSLKQSLKDLVQNIEICIQRNIFISPSEKSDVILFKQSLYDFTTKLDIMMVLQSNNFHELKKLVISANQNTLRSLLIGAACSGVYRDVELMLPQVIANDMYNSVNEAFCAAAQNNHILVMELLINNGADIHYNNDFALTKAVQSGHPESVLYLLANKADVHVDNDRLLIICCQYGDYVDVLQLLIDSGIDVLKQYLTAYNICLGKKHANCATLLIKYSNMNVPEKKPPPTINLVLTNDNDLNEQSDEQSESEVNEYTEGSDGSDDYD